jgi:uncharacterized membrane protein YvbJ
MSLIKCHDCGGQASTDAKACPACGATLKTFKNRIAKTIRIIWIALCALVLTVVFRSCYMAGEHINTMGNTLK